MGNTYFKFKKFTINQDKTAMKVGVDGVLLGAWVDVDNAQNMLDIGTGTGLLSLMLAQKSSAHIVAVEIDENACNQAKENVLLSKWSERIEIVNTSIQEFAISSNQKFDLVICNPPYFSASLNSADQQRNIARHDDNLPLDILIASVVKLLVGNGRFSMIYPFDKKNELLNIAKRYKLSPKKILNIKGTEQKKANRLVVELSFGENTCDEKDFVVRNAETNDYTNEYKQLTKEYYLKF